MLSLLSSPAAFAPVAAPIVAQPRAAPQMGFGKTELAALAKEQNPLVGYYDPLNLAMLNMYGSGDEGTIGFLRHAEIKHGRVAMAAFIGFIVHSNDIRFPWDGIAQSVPKGLSAPAVWDALPEAAKWQIILFVGFLEVYSEHSFILQKQGQNHYMKGGKPGYFPELVGPNGFGVHDVPLNLFDPFNLSKNRSAEAKAKGLIAEVNNGRFAMIGIFGFLAESKVPGSVPFGPQLAQYTGEVMAPFEGNFHIF